jgi:4'-phosphopantetheinyl transferase
LANDEVHLWCASLQEPTIHLRRLRAVLSPDEASRADRFYGRGDRERFIARRGLLREILGGYVQAHPSALRFTYGPSGKPALTARRGGRTLSFNLSHSHGLVLYAVTANRALGIDLEYVRDSVECEQISAWAFSASEHAALVALPLADRHAAFFRAWTRKEAYIKATGRGLSRPLDEFEVPVAPDRPAQLLSDRGDPAAPRRWSFRDLQPADGYAAALAVEGRGWRLICRSWPQAAAIGVDDV